MKKEWKRVLSLVLALAMVLSTCTFVFAEDETTEGETTVKTEYDFKEYFVTTDTFDLTPKEDYTVTFNDKNVANSGLTLAGGSSWNVASWWAGQTKLLYDKDEVYRAGAASRAYSDGKNLTLSLAESATTSATARIPNMVATYNSSVKLVDSKTLYNHYDGTGEVVYGDDGYAMTTFWPYGGCIGYGFSTGAAYNNSGMGNVRTHQLVEFTAPRSGVINPEVRIFSNSMTNLAYRMYVVKAGETWADKKWTNIYPAPGTGSTITCSTFALGETEAKGWTILSASADERRNNATLWINEGDKIYLHFAYSDGVVVSDGFALDTLKVNYVTKQEFGYFTDTRTVDVRVDGAPEGTTYDVAAGSGLTKSGTEGVFNVTEAYVDGKVVPVTITAGSSSAVMNITLKAAVYDVAEAFYTTTDYSAYETAADKYSVNPLPAKNANDGTGIWTLGYYSASDTSALTTFYKYTGFGRIKNYRAYEDTGYTGRSAAMVWSIPSAYFRQVKLDTDPDWLKVDTDGGWSLCDTNAATGSVGYSFGSTSYYIATGGISQGGSNSAHPSVIFTAPIAGVINPTLKAGATTADTAAYRMYKLALDGTITQIYPLPTETDKMIQLKTNTGVVYAESNIVKNNWAMLPAGEYLVQNKGLVRVNKGDQIITRFAAYNAASKYYGLSELKMTYLGRFGENDELLLDAPFANYDSDTYEAVYTGDPSKDVIDLSREIANTEAKGSMKYTITADPEGVLKAATGGTFELTGKLNVGKAPAVVEARYYSNAGVASSYYDTIEVYVNAKSAGSATFTYDLFKASQLGYDGDGFLLPYYSDDSERQLYGEIDLGITDDWKNAIVTISGNANSDGEKVIEYLGNGRVRVLAAHDYTSAGGDWRTPGNADSSIATAPANGSNPAIRDTTTAGANPVKMTVKATDGGTRVFNIWTFPVTVQTADEKAAESYTAKTSESMSNAVVKVEQIVGMDITGETKNESFVPMYPDSSHKRRYSPLADDMYLSREGNNYWAQQAATIDPLAAGNIQWGIVNQTIWEGITTAPYVDFDGISFTFVAPKDGTINLTNHIPGDNLVGGSNNQYLAAADFYGEVRKYSVNGTCETIYKVQYPKANNDKDTKTTQATVISGTPKTDGSFDIAVKKGDQIRVMLYSDYDHYVNSGFTSFAPKDNNNYLAPVFTYSPAGEASFETGLFEATIDTDVTPVADGVLMMIYNAADELVEVVKGATSTGVGFAEIEYATTEANISYARLFFWDDLTNIQPLIGDITVRK